ncbi:MAG: hypothetical protein ACE5EK_00130 [Nitrospinales bacterium]
MARWAAFMAVLVFSFPLAAPNAQSGEDEIDYEKIFKQSLSRGGKYLKLGGKKIGDRGVKILASHEMMRKVTRLDLRYNAITAVGAKYLAESQLLKGLQVLVLRHNFIGDEGTKAVAESAVFSNLVELQLGWNEIHDPGGMALARSKTLVKLKKLDLRGNFLADSTKETLKQAFKHLPKLRFF